MIPDASHDCPPSHVIAEIVTFPVEVDVADSDGVSAPSAARRSRADESASGPEAGILARSQDALRTASEAVESVAATKELLRQRRSASASELLQNSEFARLFKRASTMAVIEQAKGILMFYEHCCADEAFDILRRASQRSNVPVREIAAAIVERTSG